MQLSLDPNMLAVAVFVVDVEEGPRFRFAGMNPAAEAEFGFTQAFVDGKLFADCFSERLAQLLSERYAECARSGRPTQFEDYVDLIEGRKWFRTTLSPTLDPASGRVTRITAISQNISGTKRLQAQMTMFAYADPLTGLANRRGFDQALEQAVRTQQGFSLAVVDLDGLKDINDRHGHQVGDDVIRFVGTVLTSFATGRETVARVGGDEFYLLLREATRAGLDERLSALTRLVDSGLLAPGCEEPIGLSVGGALWTPGDDAGEVLSLADARMYAIKSARSLGRGAAGPSAGRYRRVS